MEREGFRKAQDLDKTIFTLESDTEGDLLPIFGEVCNIIDRTLGNGENVLVWDVGGGVTALAAYRKYNTAYALTSFTGHLINKNFESVMRTYDVCLPEAMMAITRARLKRVKPTLLPSQRIIDLLHNRIYLKPLDMWQACKHDVHENIITNPSEPRKKWMIKSVGGKSEKKRHDVLPISESVDEKLSPFSEQPHRLSTIAEVEEEVRRLSTNRKEEVRQDYPRCSFAAP